MYVFNKYEMTIWTLWLLVLIGIKIIEATTYCSFKSPVHVYSNWFQKSDVLV